MPRKKLVPNIISKLPGKSMEEILKNASLGIPGELPKLKLIVIIADWQNSNIISNICVEEKLRFHFICHGKGTASSEILDLLGIGVSEKAVILCIEQEIGITTFLKEVRKKIISNGRGAGIAFTIPFSAVNDPLLLIFKQSILKSEKIQSVLSDQKENDKKENKQENKKEGAAMEQFSNDLIMCIVNHGNSDEVMNTARNAGARGGTVIHARGQAHDGVVKFFGVSVQDVKEIILILTEREKKQGIMQAICKTHGFNSEANGIIFSLPVDNVMGLNLE